jgi:O-antigen/teichoic acid export membrane protein
MTERAPVDDSGLGESIASDMGAVAIRGGAIRVLGYLTGVLVSLGAASILVRHLGIAAFGRYVTVISLVTLVGGVTEAGIAVYGIREFGARADAERRQLLADLLGMRLTLTFVGVVCAVGFGLAVGYGRVLVVGTVVAGAGLLVQVVADVLGIPLQSQLRLGRLTFVDLLRRVLALALIAALALAGASLLAFLAVTPIAGIGALCVLAWMVRASVAVRASWSWRRWRALFADTLPFALAISIGAIYFYVTVIVMSLIASALQTGYFATSFRVTQVALGIPALALTAIFPLLTSRREPGEPDVGAKLGRVFDVAVIFGVWMSLAMALGASAILDVVAGARGHGAIGVLRIQGLVLTAAFVSAASMFGLLALRRYRPMLIASSCALLLNVALGLALIPGHGARGGAIADVVTEIAVAAWLTASFVRLVPQHTIDPRVLAPVALAGALAAVTALLPGGPVVHVILATGVYFGVLLVSGAIPAEVTDAARRLRGRQGSRRESA